MNPENFVRRRVHARHLSYLQLVACARIWKWERDHQAIVSRSLRGRPASEAIYRADPARNLDHLVSIFPLRYPSVRPPGGADLSGIIAVDDDDDDDDDDDAAAEDPVAKAVAAVTPLRESASFLDGDFDSSAGESPARGEQQQQQQQRS